MITKQEYQTVLDTVGITSQQLATMDIEQLGHLDFHCEELGFENFRRFVIEPLMIPYTNELEKVA
jgi:flagellar assembly factor FliW